MFQHNVDIVVVIQEEESQEKILTILEDLSLETFVANFESNSSELIEPKIQQFFTEKSIIERTNNCQNYFSKHVLAIGTTSKVS